MLLTNISIPVEAVVGSSLTVGATSYLFDEMYASRKPFNGAAGFVFNIPGPGVAALMLPGLLMVACRLGWDSKAACRRLSK